MTLDMWCGFTLDVIKALIWPITVVIVVHELYAMVVGVAECYRFTKEP